MSIAFADPVAAVEHSYTTLSGEELVVPAASGVLAAASGPSGASLSASVASPPVHGSLTMSADGSFTYLPVSGYSGADSFTYRAADPSGDYATASVALTVASPPSAIATLPGGGIYTLGQSAPVSFSCSEGAGGTGLLSCDDSAGASTVSGGIGHLDTSELGPHIYTVTAVSKDGLTGSASIPYTVELATQVPKPPGNPEEPPRGPEAPPLRVDLAGRAESLHELLQTGKLTVTMRANGATNVTLAGTAKLEVHTRRKVGTRLVEVLHSKRVVFTSPGKKEVTLTLSPRGRRAIRGLPKLQLVITGRKTDGSGDLAQLYLMLKKI